MTRSSEDGVTLLVVDDRPDNLFVMRTLLQSALPGCEVLTATSGEQGLSLMRSSAVTGALVDVQMPGMDGVTFCKHVKSDPALANVPVILITSHSSEASHRVKGLEAGADDFVHRPIDNVELVARVRVMLRIRRAEDELRDINARLEETVARRTLELRDRERRLAQAEKMEALGTLAGGIAHDFNNLLTPIIGLTELTIEERKDDADVTEALSEVLAAATRAKQLVKQILTFSRRVDFDPKPLLPEPVIKEAVKLLRNMVPANVGLVCEIGSGQAMVVADPVQLHQIVINLCANAYQAIGTEAGQVTIRLDSVEVDARQAEACVMAPGAALRLQVSDTGPGIPEDLRAKIFDPFFTTKPKGEGTGLGLATVHGIVQSLHGHVSARCPPTGGTVIEVLIPQSRQNRSDDRAAGCGITDGKGTERVLVVDDEPGVLRTTERSLTRLGYVVQAASSGAEALRFFDQGDPPPDLVVTDLAMPAMTGAALIEQLRKRKPDLPVLVMSGYFDDPSGVATDRQTAHIAKPFSPVEVGQRVRELLDVARGRRESGGPSG